MNITCKMFAAARELAGADLVQLELSEGAAVADLKTALRARFPEMESLLQHAAFAIEEEYVSDQTPLEPDRDIACIPPVSGG